MTRLEHSDVTQACKDMFEHNTKLSKFVEADYGLLAEVMLLRRIESLEKRIDELELKYSERLS